jgi:hypothetical protein
VNLGPLSVKAVALLGQRMDAPVALNGGRPHDALRVMLAETVFADVEFFGVSGQLGRLTEVAAIRRALPELDEDFNALASLGGEAFSPVNKGAFHFFRWEFPAPNPAPNPNPNPNLNLNPNPAPNRMNRCCDHEKLEVYQEWMMTAGPGSSVSSRSFSGGGHFVSVEHGLVGKDFSNREGPVAAHARDVGDDRTPIDWRGEIGRREQNVGVARDTLELQLHFLPSNA